MFQTHDHVVHPKHGAGIITGTRMIKLGDQTRRYYCIALVKNDSTVMVRADQLEDSGLRRASVSAAQISEIMHSEPEMLSDNNRQRENDIKNRLEASESIEIIALLRDLIWHGRRFKLTAADRRLRDRAQQKVANELSLDTDTDVPSADSELKAIIKDAMAHHEAQLLPPESEQA